MTISPYPLLLLAGIAVSLTLWTRLARRDERLVLIYLAALVSAFLGAKIVYLAAEGWMFWGHPQRWMIWATGKTILGALLGGYLGVELAKKALGYRAATGDLFAVVAPLGITFGRVGCLLHGCCLGKVCAPAWWTLRDAQGVARWPAVPAEIGFNLLALGVFLALRRSSTRKARDPQTPEPNVSPKWPLAGQHFHLYLIAYGVFRFAHEFLRDTPRVGAALSGYQLAAVAVAALGIAGFRKRRRMQNAPVAG